MTRLFRLTGFAVVMLLAGCGSRVLPIAYTAPAAVQRGDAQVGVCIAIDQRRDADPTRYGTIRDEFGIPLKILRTEVPVATVVSRAFSDALAARNMLATSAGRYEIRVAFTRFDASRLVRLEAHVDLRASVVEVATGRVVQEIQAQSNKVSGSILALDTGILASPAELQTLMAAALNEAVDKVVDDPAFRRATGDRGIPLS